jgi:hypothetical protein
MVAMAQPFVSWLQAPLVQRPPGEHGSLPQHFNQTLGTVQQRCTPLPSFPGLTQSCCEQDNAPS